MNGKAKGSGWERDVSKILTKWISGKESPYLFWRSPSSGVLQTISKYKENTSGDIISLSPETDFFCSLFSIEAKIGYPDADFFKFFKDMKNDEIKSFWEQATTDALKSGKKAMLIFKKKNKNILLAIDTEVAGHLSEITELPKCLILNYKNDLLCPIFFDMIEFFDKVKPEHIKQLKEILNATC
jgi:hypothetical protein